jgi:hypothetical protein
LSSSIFGREALGGFFDTIELTDAVERLLGDRRADGGMDVKELAPNMRPTPGF